MEGLPAIVVNDAKSPSAVKSPVSRVNSESSNSIISNASLPNVNATKAASNNFNRSMLSLAGTITTVESDPSVTTGIAALVVHDERSDDDDSLSSGISDDESSVSSVDSTLPLPKIKSLRGSRENSRTKLPTTPSPKAGPIAHASSMSAVVRSKTVAKKLKGTTAHGEQSKPIVRNHSAPELADMADQVASPCREVKKHINEDLSHHTHHVLLSKPILSVPHIHITVNAKDASEIASHAKVITPRHGPLPVVRKAPLVHPGAIQHQLSMQSIGAASPSAHRLLSSGVPDNLIDSVESLVNAQYYAGVPHFAQATVGALLAGHVQHQDHHPHSNKSV